MERLEDVPIVEASHVLDTFATRLARIERLGPSCVRFTLTCEQQAPDGSWEHIVVCKLVMPFDAVPEAVHKTEIDLRIPPCRCAGKIWVA